MSDKDLFEETWRELAAEDEKLRRELRCPTCGCDGRFEGCWCGVPIEEPRK
jgi:hypothetical protein